MLPLHRNPTVREPLQRLLGEHPRVVMTEPLDYDRLVAVIKRCTLLLTDSGGLQKEASDSEMGSAEIENPLTGLSISEGIDRSGHGLIGIGIAEQPGSLFNDG